MVRQMGLGASFAIWRMQTPRVSGIRFRKNFGKAAGLTAGFRQSHGEIVFTMDADLADDPHEIPRFLAKD